MFIDRFTKPSESIFSCCEFIDFSKIFVKITLILDK